jgi:hypothetical protein
MAEHLEASARYDVEKGGTAEGQSGTMVATAATFRARSPRTSSYCSGGRRSGAITSKPAARRVDANQNPVNELAPVKSARISGSQDR